MTRAIVLSICLLALVGTNCAAVASPSLQAFASWMQSFEVKYESDLVLKRKFQNFIENTKQVDLLNKLHE